MVKFEDFQFRRGMVWYIEGHLEVYLALVVDALYEADVLELQRALVQHVVASFNELVSDIALSPTIFK